MDWRPTSRSRSRPPEAPALYEQHNVHGVYDGRFMFPTNDDHNKHHKAPLSTSPSIPIPGARNHVQAELASVFEDQAEHTTEPHIPYSYSPAFAPSSLPSTGVNGLIRIPSAPNTANQSPEQRAFPRHVRKTSFDHTVSRDGVLTGLTGRHQVNGKPLPPAIGTKRRAETPHHESMLRGDPSNVGQRPPEQFEAPAASGSSFPSTPFNFQFQPYEGLFPAVGQDDYRYHHHQHNNHQTYTGSSSDGLSAAAVAASAAMAEGYAQLNAADLAGVDDSLLDYSQLLGIVYDGSLGNPYTHVDPTQILPQSENASNGTGASVLGGGYPNFASPSSDGWGNGVGGSSSNASPEQSISNASTPPSTESPSTNVPRSSGRKYIPLKGMQREKSFSTTVQTELRSSASTPDLAGTDKGGGEEGDQTPTLCTNCQTTNTPLWRRDPEGQPLCTCYYTALRCCVDLMNPFSPRQCVWLVLCMSEIAAIISRLIAFLETSWGCPTIITQNGRHQEAVVILLSFFVFVFAYLES